VSTAERVRALLVTPNGEVLTIKRTLPGQEPYWVLPGGGVDPEDTSREAALDREIREELAAQADIHGLLSVMDRPGERQFFYLCRVRSWSFEDRSGPEFGDSSRGQYQLQAIPLTVPALSAIDLKPDHVAEILLGHLRADVDLFALPDLRTTAPINA
jgi:8-oxo-dGTP pyrophosphatase MutT (NUDIX family)